MVLFYRELLDARRLSAHFIERGIWPVLSMVGMWYLCSDHMCLSTTHHTGTHRGWAFLIGDKSAREEEAWGSLGYFCTKMIIMFCTKIEPVTKHFQIS